ncbi:MAG: hypothetical protein QXT25_02350 [Candidatus Anstonellaceae archaeon]
MQESLRKIAQLLDFCFAPKENERMLFLSDYPKSTPNAEDEERKSMFFEYYKAAEIVCKQRKCRLLPAVLYEQTGKHNAELPKTAATLGGGHVNDLHELIASCSIALAITKYSATAPLKNIALKSGLRAISMPSARRDMEGAILADYDRISQKGEKLIAAVEGAEGFEITFDGALIPKGTQLYIDTRAKNWILDGGLCRQAGQVINLPSGEVFTAPYEGLDLDAKKIFGESQTRGIWPIYSESDGKVAFLHVQKNRIVRVVGNCQDAERIRQEIALEPEAANIAEIGFGINEKARGAVGIPILEREKAGPHIAYGRNDHFGGAGAMVGKVKANVHVDYVYTDQTPITATVFAVYKTGKRVLIAQRGRMVAV